jgi:uncharacterized protein YabN with tetrapyrrole methylase and pyrophosphatase domain
MNLVQLKQAMTDFLKNTATSDNGAVYEMVEIFQDVMNEIADPSIENAADDRQIAYYVAGQCDCILEEIESTVEHNR